MEVKVKLLSDKAVMPTFATAGDAGADLIAATCNWDEKQGYWEYGTDISLEIPEGYVGLIFPRSSISKYDLMLTNSVGVIDSGYRGPIGFRFKWNSFNKLYSMLVRLTGGMGINPVGLGEQKYKVGDKIGQLIIMPCPAIEFIKADALSETQRGENGWGSTGI